jgi:hypothetical protein
VSCLVGGGGHTHEAEANVADLLALKLEAHDSGFGMCRERSDVEEGDISEVGDLEIEEEKSKVMGTRPRL